MDKIAAQKKIKQLVEKYDELVKTNRHRKYNEEETKKDFILPLFEALGWNIFDREEVSAEEKQSNGRVDYGFYFNGRAKFYLEAKSLPTDLNKEEHANQAIRYSWNKGVNWAILTDFESIKIFNAQDISKYLSDKLFFQISCNDYIERFGQLWLLSKEAFENNQLDKEAEKVGKLIQKVSVTEKLYKDLNECRTILVNDLSQWNDTVSKELIDEGVQKILDRLIFLRVAEDRNIEPPILKPLLREWEGRKDKSKVPLYQSMVSKFREFDSIYNSNLFSPHPFEKWEDYSGATKKVIDKLYGVKGYYEYDFKAMPADVLGAVYENYLGYRLSQSKTKSTLDKSDWKRKEQGIYYTPTYIVDYIVDNTLKPLLSRCKSVADLKKIKVLDPACGSGSFLTKALQVIYEKYIEFGNPGGVYTKLSILLENIYGVDLDRQAVEITRLNLLVNALDERMKLPALDKNIKNGNSLISGTDSKLIEYFGKNFRDKKPFNWKEEYPEVFKQGGFDVIIGNPPYGASLDEQDKNYFADKSSISEYQLDTYLLFIEFSIKILKPHGALGMILPNTWLTNIKVNKLRQFLVSETTLLEITNFSKKIFSGATVDNIVLVLEKSIPHKSHTIKLNSISDEANRYHKVFQSNWINQKVFNVHTTDKEKKLIDRIESDSIPLEKICKVTVGIKPYQIGKGNPPQNKEVVENRIFDSIIPKDPTYRIYLRGKNINRYIINSNKNQWISYGQWLAEPRKKELFDDKEKIVIRQTGDSLTAALDQEGFLCLNNMHTINIENTTYDIKYVLGLINSSLLNYYFQYLNPEKGEALAEVKATNVKRLPIKELSEFNNKIIELVEKIISLYRELQKLEVNSESWKAIMLQINRTDKKINEEVYKIYKLTKEEIKIVEMSQIKT